MIIQFDITDKMICLTPCPNGMRRNDDVILVSSYPCYNCIYFKSYGNGRSINCGYDVSEVKITTLLPNVDKLTELPDLR